MFLTNVFLIISLIGFIGFIVNFLRQFFNEEWEKEKTAWKFLAVGFGAGILAFIVFTLFN